MNNVPYNRMLAKPIAMMVLMIWVFVSSVAAAPKDFNHSRLASETKTKFIVPGYRRFGKALANLSGSLSKLCASPGQAALLSARSAYRETISAWGTVEIINFGPVVENNRFERIFYWPDRKGRGRRQVLKLLKRRDKTALSPSTLAKKSVAVQGLTALETLLFGKVSVSLLTSIDQGYGCRYAVSIAENLSFINALILKGWMSEDDFAKLWSAPGPDNPVYLSSSETTLEIVKALDLGLENVRDRRLAPILGVGAKRRKSKPVLWRSKLSMTLIHANITALRALLFKAGLSNSYIQSKTNTKSRAQDYMASVKSEFDTSLDLSEQLFKLTNPFPDRDLEVKVVNLLVSVGFHLKKIRLNNIPDIKEAAGLVVGFNASDGD